MVDEFGVAGSGRTENGELLATVCAVQVKQTLQVGSSGERQVNGCERIINLLL